jgi:hypothetical protein
MPKRFAFVCAIVLFLNTSARAQPQNPSPSPPPTLWDHNGSVVYLVANGSSREFYYQKPRPGLAEVGARPGSLLFRGQINDGQYSGTAYIFNPRCGPIPFQVKGRVLDNDDRIVFTGQAPRVGRNCRTRASYTSNLEFRRLESDEIAQAQAPSTAVQTPAVEQSKPEVPSTAGGKPPNAPTPPSSTNETPSATKDSSRDASHPEVPSTPTARPSGTNETQSEGKYLNNYIWGAALAVVVIVSLFGFSIRKKKSGGGKF